MKGIVFIFLAYLVLLALGQYLVTVNGYAEINRRSVLLLRLMLNEGTRHGGARVVRKEARSLKELRVKPALGFFYDKGFVLTLLNIVLVQSVNILVLH